MIVRVRNLLAPAIMAAAVGACISPPDRKIEGIPPLAVKEHVAEAGGIAPQCLSGMAWWHWTFLMLPVACSHIDFDKRTCDIYVSANSSPETVEHERLHCKGYDHDGVIQRAFDAWSAAQQRAGTVAGAAVSNAGTPRCSNKLLVPAC